MPGQYQSLDIKPGVYTIATPRGAEGRWKMADHVRFWRGLVQKLGGWQPIVADALFAGQACAAADWQALNLDKIIALGTELKLYVLGNGQLTDITPLRDSGTLTDPFTTTASSAVVQVDDTAHGLYEGDYAVFSGASAVGGITIDGSYPVTSVIDADTYTITHSAPAGSDAGPGGGTVDYEYEIHVGPSASVVGPGFGAGPYSGGTYGTPRTVVAVFLALARTWGLDNWGEDLIANPRGGGIYVWDKSAGGRATVISGAPSSALSIFVSEENRILVALGANDGSNDDPMLIRWSSTEDYTDFTPTALNTAGDKRLDHGNELYGAIKTESETLIFTDAALYSMAFVGYPYQFSFDIRGQNGGIAGPNAAKEANNVVYWMGDKNFYYYNGRINLLDCDVLNHVFDDINWTQRFKVWAGANRQFSEVWWLYPSRLSVECDRYVVYNTAERHWSIGTLSRSVFVGDSKTFPLPYAAGTDGRLYTHEMGVDADTGALEWSLESGDMDIGDGDYLMRVDRMVPDFLRIVGSVNVELRGRRFPQSSEQVESTTETITASTEYVSPKLRTRQLAVLLTGDGLTGNDFAMGKMRLELLPHGKR